MKKNHRISPLDPEDIDIMDDILEGAADLVRLGHMSLTELAMMRAIVIKAKEGQALAFSNPTKSHTPLAKRETEEICSFIQK